MDPFTYLARKISGKARAKRGSIFRDLFHLGPDTKILDLGSESGANISQLLRGTGVESKNVYIADIDSDVLEIGARKYGFNPILIGESEKLPFEDQYFDIVYCSSVIEHVTVPKTEVWSIRSGREFKSRSRARQSEFSAEIQRLGKQYFVQTPYRNFPIESHSWLPFVAWLPRPVLIKVLGVSNLFWVKKTSPDWHLLDKKEMHELFRDAEIFDESFFGMTKSIMAAKVVPTPIQSSEH